MACSSWQNVSPGTIAFILAGSLLACWEHTQMAKVSSPGKERATAGAEDRTAWAGSRSHQSVILAPPTSTSGHCDDGHTHFTGIWVLDLKQCDPETLIFTFCTKCKQCKSPQMQFNPKPKLSPGGLEDPGNCKMFLLLPHGGAILADLQSSHFLAPSVVYVWENFGGYCPIILIFSCYNLAKSSKHSLGDVCIHQWWKLRHKDQYFGLEVRSDEILGGSSSNCHNIRTNPQQSIRDNAKETKISIRAHYSAKFVDLCTPRMHPLFYIHF